MVEDCNKEGVNGGKVLEKTLAENLKDGVTAIG